MRAWYATFSSAACRSVLEDIRLSDIPWRVRVNMLGGAVDAWKSSCIRRVCGRMSLGRPPCPSVRVDNIRLRYRLGSSDACVGAPRRRTVLAVSLKPSPNFSPTIASALINSWKVMPGLAFPCRMLAQRAWAWMSSAPARVRIPPISLLSLHMVIQGRRVIVCCTPLRQQYTLYTLCSAPVHLKNCLSCGSAMASEKLYNIAYSFP
mmetsp:Transcript_17450/g.45367  ORF Transcript_17450/g.45367 Transcript_17450/m.45367 type:complete len:206 (+) Transcript_17450:392-1009(+)